MSENNSKKVPILVIGYDEIEDYKQFKIALLKSVNFNLVSKIYYVEKGKFTDQIEKFCDDFDVEREGLIPLPAKPSNEQEEKLLTAGALVVFNNGEDKRIKKYETLVKNNHVFVKIWKINNKGLVLE